MEEVHATCDTPVPNCVHKTVSSDVKLSGRKSRSAWKRTKRFLICSSCGGNESDNSDTCDGHMRTILNVPLCSGDKNMDRTAKIIPAIVENVENDNLVSLSDDHFSEVELDRINPEEIIKTVMDKYSPSCANVTMSESHFKAGSASAVEKDESGEVIENINSSTIQKKQCLEIVGQIHESDYVDKEGNVQDAFQEVSDQEALVDVTEYDPGDISEVGKGSESVTEGAGEERSDFPAQADVEIKDETAKEETKEAVELESVYEKKDIPQEDRCVLGIDETCDLPDAGDVDVGAEDVASTTDGEGHEQAYLQEVISDRALRRAEIARRVEFLDSLLMREYRAKEVVDETLLTALADEVGVASEDLAGVPSIEAFVEKVEAGCDVVPNEPGDALAVCGLASLGIGEQVRATEDPGARVFIGAHLPEEVDAVAFEVARVDTPASVGRVKCTNDANFDYLGAIVDKEPKGHNVTVEYYDYDALLGDNILYDTPIDADNDDGIEVGEVVIKPEELTASPSDAVIEAPTGETRELSEDVPLEKLADRNCEVIAEDNEVIPNDGQREKVAKDKEDIAKADSGDQNDAVVAEADEVEEDDREPAEISQPFVFDCDAVGPTCTSRWRGGNPRAPQDFAQEVAQEIIDPMLAEAVHAVANDIPLAPIPSSAWLTNAVADLGCLQSPATKSCNVLDAAPSAAETPESTQADLGEAFLGWMKATASVDDLDALLNALETTESTLEDLGEKSLESNTTDNDLDELVSSLETTDWTLEDLGEKSLESTTTDNDLAELVSSLESTLEDLGEKSLESITTDNDLNLEAPALTSAGLEEAPIELAESTTTVGNLDSLAPSLEANGPIPDGLKQFNPATSLDCVESTSSVQSIDKQFTALKISESLATLDAGSDQRPRADDDLETIDPTSLAASSQADLAADSAATSLIELTHKASLVDLLPTPSVVGLAASSSESIDDASASASASMEEAEAVASMAAASNSAEWPDQGKEQHRAARSNNKRNKKRNKRGGKK